MQQEASDTTYHSTFKSWMFKCVWPPLMRSRLNYLHTHLLKHSIFECRFVGSTRCSSLPRRYQNARGCGGVVFKDYAFPVGKITEKAACKVYFWQHGTVFWVLN